MSKSTIVKGGLPVLNMRLVTADKLREAADQVSTIEASKELKESLVRGFTSIASLIDRTTECAKDPNKLRELLSSGSMQVHGDMEAFLATADVNGFRCVGFGIPNSFGPLTPENMMFLASHSSSLKCKKDEIEVQFCFVV